MSGLSEAKRMFEQNAALLGDYDSMTKTELANGYCDAKEAHDENKRSQYQSALILKYWNNIHKWIGNSASLNYQPEDFIEWFEFVFWSAFMYKLWRYEYKPIFNHKGNKCEVVGFQTDANGNKIENPYYYKKDPNAVDKIINRCLGSVRGMYYQYANKDKRKTNTQTYSVEGQTDENGDCALDYMGCTSNAIEYDGTKELVNIYLKRSRIIEALIVDGIVNGDAFKSKKIVTHKIEKNSQGADTNKKYIAYNSTFDKRKLVQHLTSIDEKYIANYFCHKYAVEKHTSESIYNKLRSLKNPKLYKYIEKVLLELQSNKKLLSCLTGN